MISSLSVERLKSEQGLPPWAMLNKEVLCEALEHIHRNWVFSSVTLYGPLRFLVSPHHLSLNKAWNFDEQRNQMNIVITEKLADKPRNGPVSHEVRLELEERIWYRVVQIFSQPSQLKSVSIRFSLHQGPVILDHALSRGTMETRNIYNSLFRVLCNDLMHVRFVMSRWGNNIYRGPRFTAMDEVTRIALDELKQRAESAISGPDIKVTMHRFDKKDEEELVPLALTFPPYLRTDMYFWIIEATSAPYRRTQAWKNRVQFSEDTLIYSDPADQQ